MYNVISFPLTIARLFITGITFKLLWLWFVVGQFAGVPQINIWGACGLVMLAQLTQVYGFKSSKEIDDTDKSQFARVSCINSISHIIAALVTLLLGAIVHSFM